MQRLKGVIVCNEPLTEQVWRMRLVLDRVVAFRPGQFVEVQVPSFFLRRPISVCDVQEDAVDSSRHVMMLVYKTVGGGTREMASLTRGTQLDILAPLGNGYDLSRAGEKALLIGGGVGIPPLYLLARQLRAQGKEVQVVLGFNAASEAFYVREFEELGCAVCVTTADGSMGEKGFVTDAVAAEYTNASSGHSVSLPYYYACGPLPMLRAVVRQLGTNGEMSMEERMGCGFGVCMGCSIPTASGPRRVCTDGPVFKAEELNL